MYFTYLDHYVTWLVPAAIAGIVAYGLSLRTDYLGSNSFLTLNLKLFESSTW